jgi:hypothetical protein
MNMQNLLDLLDRAFKLVVIVKNWKIPSPPQKSLSSSTEKPKPPYFLTPEAVLNGVGILSQSITNRQINAFVSLSANASVVASMLQVRQRSFCDTYICHRLATGMMLPSTRISDRKLLLPNGSTLLVPEVLFTIPKDTRIMLVDDFFLAGIAAYVLKEALEAEGFRNVDYISLVKLKYDHQDPTIIPQIVGIELNNSSVVFPWEPHEQAWLSVHQKHPAVLA